MFYGLSRQRQAFEMAKDVVIAFDGYARPESIALLIETAMQETQLGKYRDPTDGAGRGITQFDKMPLEDCIQRAKQSEADIALEKFGVDIYKIDHDDLDYAPLVSFIMTRIKYKRIPDAIPKTIEGRAEYWKKHYNSILGKGTVEEYIHNAQSIQWPEGVI